MKIIVFLLTVLLLVISLVSCKSDTTNPPDETEKETVGGDIAETDNNDKKEEPKRLSEEEKAKYHKLVEFELPENFRDAIVEYMIKCSEVKWVAKDDFGMVDKFGDSWGVNLSYTKGKTYYGVPYTDYIINYEYFEDELVDGAYYPKSQMWRESPGLNCRTAIIAAYQQFEPRVSSVASWTPGQDDFWMKIVGDYEVPKGAVVTQEICDLNGKEKMYESYAQLQKGDIIYDMNDLEYYNLHCRVIVEEPTLVKNGAGKVIPSRSYVTCIEQTNSFDKSRTDGVNTTWYINHKYSLENLFEKGYVPLTLEAYDKPRNEMEAPYLGIDAEITSSILSKGAITGMVKSNFPLLFVRCEILDKEGNVVVSEEKGNLYKTQKMNLRNEFSGLFSTLEKGKDYTFVLKAGISPGNTEFARVDFTYNK